MTTKQVPWKTTQEYDVLHDDVPGYIQNDGSVSTQKCPYISSYQDCAISDPRVTDCPRFGGWKGPHLNLIQCRGKRYFDAVKEPEPATIGTTWRE